jgi:aminoglycoside phosphotransferase family enzyme
LKEPFAKFIEAELPSGFLLIACGLPGTWKTETTGEVAKIKGYPLLRSDLIRLEVLKNEDIFDEKVAFLAMDLDHYQRADLSRCFVDAYVAQSRDKELLKLLNFYKCYRAYVRGKVESFKFDDSHISDEERARALATARSYFNFAQSYI